MADAYTDVAVPRGGKAVHSLPAAGSALPVAWHLTVAGGLDISLEVVFRPLRVGAGPVIVQPAARVASNGGCFRWYVSQSPR